MGNNKIIGYKFAFIQMHKFIRIIYNYINTLNKFNNGSVNLV